MADGSGAGPSHLDAEDEESGKELEYANEDDIDDYTRDSIFNMVSHVVDAGFTSCVFYLSPTLSVTDTCFG